MTSTRRRWGPMAALLLLATALVHGRSSAGPLPAAFELEATIGHDANLLDASNAERIAFQTHDPESFFVVNGMRDQFLDGRVRGEWRLPRLLAGRPSLSLEYQRRQYLYNPIKSSDQAAVEARLRLASGTRIDLQGEFMPQVYGRHRLDRDALPGEPEFRPEVYRRGDASAVLVQALGAAANLEIGGEGSIRNYRPPFDARDRHMAGGLLGLAGSVSHAVRLGVRGAYERTWTRNQPALPTDLSFREWIVSPWLSLHPRFISMRLAFETGWRRYTSADPLDDSHFGRKDLRNEAEIEIGRQIVGPVSSITRLVRRWQSASIPIQGFDEDAFTDTEVETGFRWSYEAPARSPR